MMGWAKFDDGFTDHPKVAAAGPWAELLAVRGVIYAAKHETDGFIPDGQLPRLGVGIPAVRKRAAVLVDVGLWGEVVGGWLIHDFLDYHPSKAVKEDERAKARERMREVRANTPRTSGNPDPTPTPNASSASNGFVAFNARRAVEATRERKRQGLRVKSESGLAKTIQADPEHVAESQRLWAHRDCPECKGKGVVGVYSPGAGMRSVVCGEGVG
jgi:hypothetical protein